MSVYKNELNLLCIPWMISQSPKAAWATDFCYCSSDPRDPTSTKRFGLTPCGHRGSWPMPLPHSSSKSHRGEGHVSTGGGSAQICVDKTQDRRYAKKDRKCKTRWDDMHHHGFAMLPKVFSCCVGVCKWIRTQQWIKLSKGSLPRKDIGSGWWFIVIQPDILQVFNQLSITVCRNGYLLIETNSQEITFCQWSFLYSQQLHR